MRFGDIGRREVFVAFDGGETAAYAGVFLRRERAQKHRMAVCFADPRDTLF